MSEDQGTTTINVAGKERELRLTLQAFSDIGDELELTFGDLSGGGLEDKLGELSLSAIQRCLYLMLRADDPELTYEDVGRSIDHTNAAELMRAFFELFGGTSASLVQEASDKVAAIRAETEEQAEALEGVANS